MLYSSHMGHSDEIIIEPGQSYRHAGRELWQYRELFFFLAWRNLLVRYKQTFIGVLWAVLRPVLTMMIFTFVFSRIAQLPSYNIPYPLLVLGALLPWQFFSSAITESSDSLVADANLISKVYFPRLIIPTSCILTALVDLMIALVFFIMFMLCFRIPFTMHLLFLPLLMIPLTALSLGIGYFLSALNIRFRDFRYAIPFLVQLGLYISPIGFSSYVVPEQWRLLYGINPIAGIVEAFRWSLLGGAYPLDVYLLSISLLISFGIFLWGLKFFVKNERRFADII